MRWIVILMLTASPVFADDSLRLHGNTSSCMYKADKASGTIMVYGGCSNEMVADAAARARRERTPNPGDFEDLNKKLDRIIQLLDRTDR